MRQAESLNISRIKRNPKALHDSENYYKEGIRQCCKGNAIKAQRYFKKALNLGHPKAPEILKEIKLIEDKRSFILKIQKSQSLI
jgi:TPR repeat protein